MAVPQPTDARMPCPVCRAPIHPIAGRCKHCKSDLAAVRQARPAAAAALPPLVKRGAQRISEPMIPATITTPSPFAGPAAASIAAAPLAVPIEATPDATIDESRPILPPRPTGRMGSATVSKRPAWKSWPMLVIALATIAIVVAVILMAIPPKSAGADSGNGGKLEPPPAHEHMDQNPLLPNQPHSQVSPPAAPDPQVQPRHTPDPIPSDPDPADPADPFAGLGGGAGGLGTLRGFGGLGGTFGSKGLAVMSAVLKHACDRLSSCGSADDTMRMSCAMLQRTIPAQPLPTCDAAQRCIQKVDALDCSAKVDDALGLMSMATQFTDCLQAMTNC